jgi:hypothetical protein
MTAVANTVFTAAQFNTHVRDNLNETAPAKATTSGSIFVTSATNEIAERIPSTSFETASETITSTSYTDPATPGPGVTVTTGASALVMISCRLLNSLAGQNTYASYEVSGTSSSAANDDRAILFTIPTAAYSAGFGHSVLHTGLTPGSNTFTMKYRVTGGTGTVDNRRIVVLPL